MLWNRPTLVELVGATGQYDYIEFTAEYAPFTMHDLDNLGRAFELAGVAGMIKIEQGEHIHQSLRAIGSGFQSVLRHGLAATRRAELHRHQAALGQRHPCQAATNRKGHASFNQWGE